MAINAEKCLSNGSNPGLGFKVDGERRFYVDEEEAAIVREIYERYASGETKAEIIRDLKHPAGCLAFWMMTYFTGCNR